MALLADWVCQPWITGGHRAEPPPSAHQTGNGHRIWDQEKLFPNRRWSKEVIYSSSDQVSGTKSHSRRPQWSILNILMSYSVIWSFISRLNYDHILQISPSQHDATVNLLIQPKSLDSSVDPLSVRCFCIPRSTTASFHHREDGSRMNPSVASLRKCIANYVRWWIPTEMHVELFVRRLYL